MTAPDGAPVVCCDLDGVLWRGDEPIAGSADAVAAFRQAGLRVGFLSNNSSQPRVIASGIVVDRRNSSGVFPQ